jgi:hypothetical protein
MGGFLVECDGEFVQMPFDGDWQVDDLEGRLPDRALLQMDETRFNRGFESQAAWTQGKGNYATLAYCRELTIERHKTLREAIVAKRAIDHSGCGGACVRVHLIIRIDPTNSRHAREQDNIRRHQAAKHSTNVSDRFRNNPETSAK